MKALYPYLTFDGNAREAFGFYEQVFGGRIVGTFTYADMGMGDGPHGDLVAHIHIALSDGIELMGSDVTGDQAQAVRDRNGFSLLIAPESADEAQRLFSALSEGGEVTMELQKTDWAQLYGECRDRFGILWSFNLDSEGTSD